MILPDANVLVAAYREDHVHHVPAYAFLKRFYESREVLALCDLSLSGLLRVVSHPKIFRVPSPLEGVFAFTNALLQWPSTMHVAPGSDHWKIFEDVCRKSGAAGAMVTDAYIAALALEHGCAVATFDKDFERFEGLRIVKPAA